MNRLALPDASQRLQQVATRYFRDPAPFLQDFANFPLETLACLQATPLAFGPTRFDLCDKAYRHRRYQAMVKAAEAVARYLTVQPKQ